MMFKMNTYLIEQIMPVYPLKGPKFFEYRIIASLGDSLSVWGHEKVAGKPLQKPSKNESSDLLRPPLAGS